MLVSGRWRMPWTVIALRTASVQGYAPMNSFWLDELQWWMDLLTHWNRKSLFLSPELLIPTHAVEFAPFTDASGTVKPMRARGRYLGSIGRPSCLLARRPRFCRFAIWKE